jgi:unsaturated rhamnogalacturonyl hydrolase
MLRLCAATPFVNPFAFAATTKDIADATDWSRLVIAATMDRKPDPAQLGGWGYAIALYCYGIYLVYLRTGDKTYLTYIQGWIDKHIDDSGTINRKITALDYMLPGNILLLLYKETGLQKYKTAATSIRTTFDTYPRTEDGGFWHALSASTSFGSMVFTCRFPSWFAMAPASMKASTRSMKPQSN